MSIVKLATGKADEALTFLLMSEAWAQICLSPLSSKL